MNIILNSSASFNRGTLTIAGEVYPGVIRGGVLETEDGKMTINLTWQFDFLETIGFHSLGTFEAEGIKTQDVNIGHVISKWDRIEVTAKLSTDLEGIVWYTPVATPT